MAKTELDHAPAATPLSPWDEATAGAVELQSYDVAKDEYLDALAGIDLVITGVAYREGIPDPATKQPRAYVSLECMLAPEWRPERINLARKACGLPAITSVADLPWEPGELVVINSGSTGIYRDITKVLAATGVITLPEPVTEAGPRGESSYDLPPSKWVSADTENGYFDVTESGFRTYANRSIRVRCKKGVRVSAYSNEYADDARTYYLA